jgi:hypothetical protein
MRVGSSFTTITRKYNGCELPSDPSFEPRWCMRRAGAEGAEALVHVPTPGDQSAVVRRDVGKGTETVVLQFIDEAGIVERFSALDWIGGAERGQLNFSLSDRSAQPPKNGQVLRERELPVLPKANHFTAGTQPVSSNDPLPLSETFSGIDSSTYCHTHYSCTE